MVLDFCGADTGNDGALAALSFDPDAGRVTAVRLAAMPTRARDDGGNEIVPGAFASMVRTVAPRGWARCLIERPVRGGMVRQKKGTEFAQGDAHGVARALLEVDAERMGSSAPEAVPVGGHAGWHAQLSMTSAAKAGVNRKTLSITVAEGLLAQLRDRGAVVHGLAPCRGYDGLIGGQAAPRSGAADALLLAWLALRLWLGVEAGAPTLYSVESPQP